ncbi:MAG: hypothetical protein NC306_12535 [Butyrivibrio sp.]|nr:hypothetical protein [Butyrivibrio sp.]
MDCFQVCSQSDLAQLVQEYGFLPLFQNDVPGFSVEEHTPAEFWFADGEDGPWEWKGPVIRQTGCAYGKFFRGKAGFISAGWYPDFANYRRDGYDFDARYEDGLASYQDKTVYGILAECDSLLSGELKRLGGFGKNGRKGFDTIMTRLQMQGYVVTVDFEYKKDKYGSPYGWGVARYATPERYFGDPFGQQVYQRTPEQSKERILRHLEDLLKGVEKEKLFKIIV